MKLKRSDMVILPVALLVASASIGVHGSAISRLDHAADNIKADKSRHQQLIDDYCNLDVSKLPHSPAHPRVQIVSGNGIDEPPVDPTNFRETFGSFGDVHPDPIDKDNPLVFGKRVRVAVLAKLPRNPALGYLLRPRGQVSLAMQSVVDHDVDSSESETSGSHQSTITCRPYALRMSTQTSTANTDNDFFVRGHGEKVVHARCLR